MDAQDFITDAGLYIAAGAAPAGVGGSGGWISLAAQMLLLFAVFFFFIIRPQQQRAKAHRLKVEAVKRGDVVVTAGGLIGKVVKVDDNEVEVEISANTRVRVVRSTLSDVRDPTAKPAND